jgi:nucleoside-diphosphate-sugar epimerase
MFSRVIVTGGTGFFGSRITHALRAAGIAEQVFALGSREYDLRDESAVVRMFADLRPDAVIHAAGHVGGIGANRASPADFFYDNFKMGSLLIHHAHRHAVRKLVLIGTVCSYPKHASVPFSEDAFWTGYPEETNAPYGIAKLALFAQAEAYRTFVSSGYPVQKASSLNGTDACLGYEHTVPMSTSLRTAWRWAW